MAAVRTSVAVYHGPEAGATVAFALQAGHSAATLKKTLAAGTVPAAVIIFGSARSYSPHAYDHSAW